MICEKFRELLHEISPLMSQFETRHAELHTALDQMKGLPMTNAHPYWLNGLYLYLVYPRKRGESRRRDYVGNDPQRVAEAIELIDRSRHYRAIQAELRELENRIQMASHAFGRVVLALRHSVPVSFTRENGGGGAR